MKRFGFSKKPEGRLPQRHNGKRRLNGCFMQRTPSECPGHSRPDHEPFSLPPPPALCRGSFIFESPGSGLETRSYGLNAGMKEQPAAALGQVRQPVVDSTGSNPSPVPCRASHEAQARSNSQIHGRAYAVTLSTMRSKRPSRDG